MPDPLFKELKIRAVQQGITLKDLLAIYIKVGLRAPLSAKNIATAGKKNYPLPVAIPRLPGTSLHPALSNTELHARLVEEDIENSQRVIAQSTKTK